MRVRVRGRGRGRGRARGRGERNQKVQFSRKLTGESFLDKISKLFRKIEDIRIFWFLVSEHVFESKNGFFFLKMCYFDAILVYFRAFLEHFDLKFWQICRFSNMSRALKSQIVVRSSKKRGNLAKSSLDPVRIFCLSERCLEACGKKIETFQRKLPTRFSSINYILSYKICFM